MSTKHHRIARLLDMIHLIRGNRRLRPKDIAEYFGVSVKRVFDDIAELNAAGVPVVFEDEGYRVLPTFFMPHSGFRFEESVPMLLGLGLLEHYGVIDRKTRDTITIKVLNATSIRHMDALRDCSAEDFSKAIHIEPEWQSDTSPAVLSKLLYGCLAKRVLTIDYDSVKSGTRSRRRVAPHTLVFRKHAWYLLARCLENDELRHFRVSRIYDVQETSDSFQPTNEAEEFVDRRWGAFSGAPREVHIRFDPEVAPYIRSRRFGPSESKEEQDGSLTLRFVAGDLQEVSWWLLQYSDHVTVISPSELSDLMRNQCERMLSHYLQQRRTQPEDDA